jgi:cytochrome c-type biogenesis protein
MIAMGVLATVLAFTGPDMPSGGWQTELSAWLQHVSSVALQSLSWLPGWAVLVVFLGGLGLLLRRALRTTTTPASISNRGARENQSEIRSATDTIEGN